MLIIKAKSKSNQIYYIWHHYLNILVLKSLIIYYLMAVNY